MASSRRALLPFAVISCSYLLFTVTDGALRMIVLLHAYSLNFSAMDVAVMFVLYELAGVFTNLLAGVAGARWGIRATLVTGLLLQLLTYGLLYGWGWQEDLAGETRLFGHTATKQQAIVYITIVQMFGGVAKDLTKLGGKTVTKLVTPDEKNTQLFKIVSLLTGWKNSLKGVGYFLGSALLGDGGGYPVALGVMLSLVGAALVVALAGLDGQLGTAAKKNASLRDVFDTRNPNLNWLSLARLFLFASRDFWFEVPLPFFLRSPSCASIGGFCATDDECPAATECAAFNASVGGNGTCVNVNPGGGCGGVAWSRVLVGSVLGGYIILYGQFQALTPQLVTGPLGQTPPNKLTEVLWGLVNCTPAVRGQAEGGAPLREKTSHPCIRLADTDDGGGGFRPLGRSRQKLCRSDWVDSRCGHFVRADLCRQFFDPLLPRRPLRKKREGGRFGWVLLHVQRRRPVIWHARLRLPLHVRRRRFWRRCWPRRLTRAGRLLRSGHSLESPRSVDHCQD